MWLLLAAVGAAKDNWPSDLLTCGVLSSVLYFAADVYMSATYEGYSYLHQTVSELNAVGAPTRDLSVVPVGSGFRRYSIATIVVMLVFAAWAAMDAGRIEAGLATPWVGVIERVSFYSWHLWFIVLALRLSPKGSPTRSAAA